MRTKKQFSEKLQVTKRGVRSVSTGPSDVGQLFVDKF
jgi:hypothetical protein